MRHTVEKGRPRLRHVAERDVHKYFDLIDKLDVAIERVALLSRSSEALALSLPWVINTRKLGDTQDGLTEDFHQPRLYNASMGKNQVGAEAEMISEGQRSNPARPWHHLASIRRSSNTLMETTQAAPDQRVPSQVRRSRRREFCSFARRTRRYWSSRSWPSYSEAAPISRAIPRLIDSSVRC